MERMNLGNLIPGNGVQGLSFDLEQNKVDTYNHRKEEPGDYDCPLCGNKEGIAFLCEGKFIVRDCKCKSYRKYIRRMKDLDLWEAARRCTFDRYEAKEKWQKALKEMAQNYASNPEGWLVMSGQSGSGKTHLCTAVVTTLAQRGMDVQYMPWKKETAVLKAMSMDTDREGRMERFLDAQVLYIDDLLWYNRNDPHSRPSDADVKLAFELLTHRENNGKLTIISTELLREELGDINEAVAGRIVGNAGDRLCIVAPDRSRNYRLRGKRRV